MGLLTIKEGDVVQQLPSKRNPKRLPPFNLAPEIIWHVKRIVGGNAVVDRYIDEKGEFGGQKKNVRNLVGENELIKLTKINDDTVYKIINEQFFPMLVQLNTVTKVWTLVSQLYVNLAAAKVGLGTTNVAEIKVTSNGKYYISDDTLVPKAK